MATFGRYEILERIASGGMAEVYRARAWGAGDFAKDVVIKKILPMYSADPEFRSLFIQEARISVGLTHSRIVQVLDFGIMEGSYFIALELVDGPNLGELLLALRRAKARLPLPATIHVMTEALSGLDYAHRRAGPDGTPLEIVHRDISPGNVLLSYEGEVKIGDFGIARAAGSPSLTRVGRVRGKPQYMSPEQIRGHPLDARSDLFSAGLLLYEMLTGLPAYGGFDDNAIMNAILAGDLAPPSSRAHDLPRTFDPLLKKALNLDADQRYASAGELRQALLDVAYLERIRPDPDALAAVVRAHVPRGARSAAQAVASAVLERSGSEGELERFSTSTASRVRPTDTHESDRGPAATGTPEPTTMESTRGPIVVAVTPSTVEPDPPKATRVLPPSSPPAEERSATQIRVPRPAAQDPEASTGPMTKPPPPAATSADDPAAPIPRLAIGLAVGVAVMAIGYLVVPLTMEIPASRPSPAPSRATPVATLAVVTLEPPVPSPTLAAIATVTSAPTPLATRTPAPVAATPVRTATPKAFARATGTLSLNSKPWGEVTIDGRSAGPTPIVDLVLPAGTHAITINGAGGLSASLTVAIEPGKPAKKFVELK